MEAHGTARERAPVLVGVEHFISLQMPKFGLLHPDQIDWCRCRCWILLVAAVPLILMARAWDWPKSSFYALFLMGSMAWAFDDWRTSRWCWIYAWAIAGLYAGLLVWLTFVRAAGFAVGGSPGSVGRLIDTVVAPILLCAALYGVASIAVAGRRISAISGLEPSQRAMKNFAREMATVAGAGSSLDDWFKANKKLTAEIESPEFALKATDADIALWVSLYAKSDDADEFPVRAGMRLGAVGRRAVPHLLKALDQPGFEPKGPVLEPKFSWSPFQNVARRLLEYAPAEIVGRALTWTASEVHSVREIGLEMVCATGTDAAMPVVRAWLALWSHRGGRSLGATVERISEGKKAVISGCRRALGSGIATESFRRVFLEEAWKRVENVQDFNDADLFELLVRFDANRAIREFRTPAYLRPDRPGLHGILAALEPSKVDYRPEFLRSVIAAPRDRDDLILWHIAQPVALRELVRLLGQAAWPDVEGAMDPTRGLEGDAMKCGCSLLRTPSIYEIADSWKPGAPSQIRAILLVAILKTQVDNGGISQYFFNSYGNDWPECVEALAEFGCPNTAASLDKAARAIAPEGASKDRAVRNGQYASLTDEREKEIEEGFSMFGDGEEFERKALEYVRANVRAIREWCGAQSASPSTTT